MNKLKMNKMSGKKTKSSTHNSWEPAENLTEDLLNEFNERMSDSPKRQESRTSQVGSKRQKRSSLDKTPASKNKTV